VVESSIHRPTRDKVDEYVVRFRISANAFGFSFNPEAKSTRTLNLKRIDYGVVASARIAS